MPYNPYSPYMSNNPYISNSPYYPYQPPQQRLQTLEQQYSQFGQTMPNMQQPMPNQQVQPQPVQSQYTPIENSVSPIVVGSEEEARKYMPDISGTVQTFVQKAGSSVVKFYTKQINDNLDVKFDTYEKINPDNFISSDEKKPNLMDVVQSLNDKLDSLGFEIQQIKEAFHNEYAAKQRTSNAGITKSTGSSQVIEQPRYSYEYPRELDS